MGSLALIFKRKRTFLGLLVAAALVAAVFLWQPLSVRWQLYRARQALDEREDEQAVEHLRAALRRNPDRAETLFLLARAHRRLGNVERVPALLRRAARVGGDPERAGRETWLLLAQSGRLREVESHLPELLADPRGDAAAICEAYVQGYFTNLRFEEADRLLEAWQQDFPHDAQPHFMRAFLFHALGKMEEAIAAYRKGLKRDPDATIMRSRMAQMLMELRELDEAAEHLRRCVEEAPQEPEVLTSWGDCLFRQGDTQQARRVLERLIRHAPDHFEARRLLGEIELAQGRFEQAADHLQAAIKLRPYDTTTHNALGKALRALDRAEEAQAHFDYVAEAEPQLSLMERQLREVVERPDDPELRYGIGTTLLRYGSPEDGAKWLASVLQLDPDHAKAHAGLAAYYEARGDWQKALEHRRRADAS